MHTNARSTYCILSSGLFALATVSGCGSMAEVVKGRAAHDLQCSEVSVAASGAGGWEAWGCGASASYACDHAVDRMSVVCVREGDVQWPAPPTPSPPLPSNPAVRAFPVAEALPVMRLAAVDARDCAKISGPHGAGEAVATFSPDGRVTAVALDPPYAGTAMGECVAERFSRVTVSPFSGGPVATRKSFVVPERTAAGKTEPAP